MINTWQDLPFTKYLDIINLEQTDDDLTNSINLVAIMSGKEVKEIEKMKARDFAVLASNLEFLKEEPNVEDSTFQWNIKDVDSLTMDNFIEYETLKNDQNNLPTLLAMMSDVKADDIIKMNTLDVLHGFFLLRKTSIKYIQASAKSLLWKVTKQRLKDKFLFWQKK